LPRELQFSSEDEDGVDLKDLAGFTVILKTKKTVKYVPDHERDWNGDKIGFNYAWHESVKNEKNLIIEPPRPTVHIFKFSNQP